MERRRTGILISGRGSNMAALIAATFEPDYPAEIVLVLSSRDGVEGLDRARANGIAAQAVEPASFPDQAAFEAALNARLDAGGVEFVCLAGFMRLLSEAFVERWRDRLINIHPSLLPAFAGLNTHARALDAGVRIHGCTVHYVRAAMDDGPIIAQAAVAVVPGDTAESLGERVLAAEHRLYPLALRLAAGGGARVVGERVVFEGAPPQGAEAALFSPKP